MIRSIQAFRREKREEIEKTNKFLRDIRESIDNKYKSVYDSVVEFVASDFVPYKVASKIIENNLNQMDALKEIHIAMFKADRINTDLIVKVLPELEKEYSDAVSTYEIKEIEMMNDDNLSKLATSNAERKREVEAILVVTKSVINQIKVRYKQIKNLISFMKSCQDYLNRLDMMVKTKQKVIESKEFTEMITSSNRIMQIEM